jgi:hypothetical protein
MIRDCVNCRFSEPAPMGEAKQLQARCGWVDRAHDEAGDRMPRWAWEIVAALPHAAIASVDRGEDCPAFEERE